ncbi:MAG: FecCD family ABC transporter permease [Clostridium sp.]|uniref:FecCD family ABC transporter permease n=1 Tax=Clostridium sp. TaxID=1506 RepID=UPI003EE43F34
MQRLIKKNKLMWLSIPIAILVICVGTSIGSSNINIVDIVRIVGNKLFNIPLPESINAQDVAIIWVIRLPRVILAFIVGAILSVSGAVTQSILKNPLASPYTIGVSAGASLGVGLYIMIGISIPLLGNFTMPLIGFICGVITIFTVIMFANKVDRGFSNNTLILSGMVLSLFASAILTTLTAIFSEDLKSIAMWQMGSFGLKSWSYVIAGIPFAVIGIGIVLRYTKEMDILSFGEEYALSVGVETSRIKKILLVAVAILAGSAVALSGVIGFVDLIVPHIARRVFGSKHKIIIPMSILIGGTLMVVTDLIARTVISPSELPVGAITAIIGAPFFAYIYFGKKRRR